MTKGYRQGEPDARVIYADIIRLPHWQSPTRTPMSAYERAAQFSSFNALAGYEDMIGEEARHVDNQEVLTEDEMDYLNRQLAFLSKKIENGEYPEITITYFVPDVSKNGGVYVELTECVRRIDPIAHKIELCRRTGVSGSYMAIALDVIRQIDSKHTN